jgi:hypothetical protein
MYISRRLTNTMNADLHMIYQRLSRLGVQGPVEDGEAHDPDPDLQDVKHLHPEREPDTDDSNLNIDIQPPGSFPEPPFECFVLAYYTRNATCRIKITVYKSFNFLLFDYFYNPGDSGRTNRLNVICDKNNLHPTIQELVEGAKKMTLKSTVIGHVNGFAEIEVKHIEATFRSSNHYRESHKTFLVRIVPPARFETNFNEKIVYGCDYIGFDLRRSQYLQRQKDEGKIRLITEISTVPPPGPPE